MIRGISDYANGQKGKLDRASKGAWRRFAAANVARLSLAILTRGSIDALPPPLYDIRLTDRNDRSRKEQVFFSDKGTQDFDFSIVKETRSLPALFVRAVGLDKDSKLMKPDRSACMVYIDDRTTRFDCQKSRSEDGADFSLPRTTDVKEVALLLAFKNPVESIKIVLRDEFERQKEFSWRQGE